MLQVLTEIAKKQVEEGKYANKPLKQGLGKIEFVPQGGKVPDRKKADKTMVSQSTVAWEVTADLKDCERFFPVPTTKKKQNKKTRFGDMERGRERGASGEAHGAS